MKNKRKIDPSWNRDEMKAWYIGNSHKILAKHDISILKKVKDVRSAIKNGDELHNLTWAVNGKGTHKLETVKEVYERLNRVRDSEILLKAELKNISETFMANGTLL